MPLNIIDLCEFALSLPHAEEDMPFGPDHLVFKVGGKIFLLVPLEKDEFTFNVKCDPDRAEELRMHYEAVQPGWHMNKKHWNTITVGKDMNSEEIKNEIVHSYNLVFSKLSKKVKTALKSNLN